MKAMQKFASLVIVASMGWSMIRADGVEAAIYAAGLACFLAVVWLAEIMAERR